MRKTTLRRLVRVVEHIGRLNDLTCTTRLLSDHESYWQLSEWLLGHLGYYPKVRKIVDSTRTKPGRNYRARRAKALTDNLSEYITTGK